MCSLGGGEVVSAELFLSILVLAARVFFYIGSNFVALIVEWWLCGSSSYVVWSVLLVLFIWSCWYLGIFYLICYFVSIWYIHCDLSPDNILLHRKGDNMYMSVCDWGFTCRVDFLHQSNYQHGSQRKMEVDKLKAL